MLWPISPSPRALEVLVRKTLKTAQSSQGQVSSGTSRDGKDVLPSARLLHFCVAALPGGLTVADPERGSTVCADSGCSRQPGERVEVPAQESRGTGPDTPPRATRIVAQVVNCGPWPLLTEITAWRLPLELCSAQPAQLYTSPV